MRPVAGDCKWSAQRLSVLAAAISFWQHFKRDQLVIAVVERQAVKMILLVQNWAKHSTTSSPANAHLDLAWWSRIGGKQLNANISECVPSDDLLNTKTVFIKIAWVRCLRSLKERVMKEIHSTFSLKNRNQNESFQLGIQKISESKNSDFNFQIKVLAQQKLDF